MTGAKGQPMAFTYRVLRSQDLFLLPGIADLFNVEKRYAERLEAALNRMEAEGWRFLGTYDVPGESAHELLIFRRKVGVQSVDAQPPTAAASKSASDEPEALDLELDYRAMTLPDGAVPEPIGVENPANVLFGDLIKLALAGRFDVIVHGCNCRHTMGGGIARQIKNAFHEAEDADLATEYAAREKLGTLSTAAVVRDGREFFVVNAYTQFEPGANADYDAIRSCFQEIKRQFSGKRIGYPRIGAGIGGGDWAVISAIIDEELAGEDHTLVEYEPSE